MTKNDVLNKVRAMLSKTVDNGCTENEAMVALTMAEKLIAEHEISDEDLKLEGEKAIIEVSDMRDPQNIRWRICYFISKFTETYTYGHKKSVKFAGLKSDVDFAIWLTETLASFVHVQLKNYMWSNGYQKFQGAQRNRIINSFVIGCCQRINAKLKQMTDERRVTTNSQALVITKQSLIDDAIKDQKIGKADNRGRKNKIYGDVYKAGQEYGEKASFGRPIEKDSTLRLDYKK